jgi:hypothetical protein
MIYIGIDPDVEKSGIAMWFPDDKKLQLNLYKFFELFDFFRTLNALKVEFKVIIEAGWLNEKSNYHGAKNRQYGENIAKKVGRNHETGKKIAEMCEYLGIEYQLYKPTLKKTTPDYFEKLTGIKMKNQEKIDAGMLVFGR